MITPPKQPVTQNNTNNGGIGFIGLLTILFIALKLTGVIAWSWFWVLSPLIFGFSIIIIFLIIALIVFAATNKR